MQSIFHLHWRNFCILICLGIACHQKNATATTRYLSFQGKIGTESKIHFHLLFKEDSLIGHYAYDLIGIPLPLVGKRNNNHFVLKEIGPYGKPIAFLSGDYNATTHSLTGIWQDTGLTITLSFSAQVCPNQQALSIESTTFHEIDSPPKATPSSIDIQSLRVKNMPKNIAERINQSIQESILNPEIYGTSYKDIPHFLSSLHYNLRKNALHIDIECLVQNNTQHLFGIKVRHRIKHSLNKYPIQLIFYYNFNTYNGKEILLSDLIEKQHFPQLNRIAQRILFTMHARDTSFLSIHPFRLNHNFSLTSGGLLFLFNPYEYQTAYPLELFIPFSEIYPLLRKDQLNALLPKNALNDLT